MALVGDDLPLVDGVGWLSLLSVPLSSVAKGVRNTTEPLRSLSLPSVRKRDREEVESYESIEARIVLFGKKDCVGEEDADPDALGVVSVTRFAGGEIIEVLLLFPFEKGFLNKLAVELDLVALGRDPLASFALSAPSRLFCLVGERSCGSGVFQDLTGLCSIAAETGSWSPVRGARLNS